MVDVRLNHGNIRALITDPAEQIPRRMHTYTRRTANAARSNANVDTGHMRASVRSSVETRGLVVVGRVWSPLEYALYQEMGTGIYAGKGPIKGNPYLAFKPRKRGPARRGQKLGKSGLVVVTEVKGTPPTHWLSNALEESVPWPVHRNY